MDTSGRAVLLAGATVVIALLGMFATGVAFMYGLAIAAVLAVLLTLVASLTLLPALLSGRLGARLVRPRGPGRGRLARRTDSTGRGSDAPPRSSWQRWSKTVQAQPWPLAIGGLAVMIALLLPVLTLRLDSSDAGNDAAGLSSRHAFDLLAQGFGPGFNGPLLLVAELPERAKRRLCRHCAPRSAPPPASSPSPSRASHPRGRPPSSAPTPPRPRRRSRRRTSSTICATTCCRRSSTAPA